MTIHGASILPYCYDPEYGNMYFLLGLERHDARYKDSHTWCDFSGKTQLNNQGVMESPEETAARELWEETAACVRFQTNDTLPIRSPASLAHQLRAGKYSMKITFTDRKDRPRYVTYLVEIPFDPDIPNRFYQVVNAVSMGLDGQRKNRGEIAHQLRGIFGKSSHPAVSPATGTTDKSFTEKSGLKLVSLPVLTQACEHDDGVLVDKMDNRQWLRTKFISRARIILNQVTRGKMQRIPKGMVMKQPTWYANDLSKCETQRTPLVLAPRTVTPAKTKTKVCPITPVAVKLRPNGDRDL